MMEDDDLANNQDQSDLNEDDDEYDNDYNNNNNGGVMNIGSKLSQSVNGLSKCLDCVKLRDIIYLRF